MKKLYTFLIFFIVLSATLFFLYTQIIVSQNIDTCETGWIVSVGKGVAIDCDPCWTVNNECPDDVFVPTRTPEEWSSFLLHRPDCTSLSSCLPGQIAPTVSFDTPNYGYPQELSWNRIDTASNGYRVEIQRNGELWELYNSNVAQPGSGTVSITIPASEFDSMGTRRFRVRANATVTQRRGLGLFRNTHCSGKRNSIRSFSASMLQC